MTACESLVIKWLKGFAQRVEPLKQRSETSLFVAASPLTVWSAARWLSPLPEIVQGCRGPCVHIREWLSWACQVTSESHLSFRGLEPHQPL